MATASILNVAGIVSSGTIQGRAAEIAALIEKDRENFNGLIETAFQAGEEKAMAPFKLWAFLKRTVGEERMNAFPVPKTKQVTVYKDENGHEVKVASNNPDRYEYLQPNGKGGHVKRTGSFYGDTFDDTSLGTWLIEELRKIAVHDKEPSRYSAMQPGERDSEAAKLQRKQRTGRGNMAVAGAFHLKMNALKAMKYGNGQPCFLVGFAIVKRDNEEVYDFTGQPIRVIDNSDPANGSLGKVKYCSVTWFNGINVEELHELDDKVNKWDFLMTPKKREQPEGQSPASTIEPIEGTQQAVDTIAEFVAWAGDPTDDSKDGFYARMVAALAKPDSDDLAENCVVMYDLFDRITDKLGPRVTALRERRAANLKAA